MMHYNLWARWAQRAEDLSACALRFARTLEEFAAAHVTLGRWCKLADTRAAAYKPFCAMPPRLPELEAILLSGRHFTSGTHELIPDLGYSVAAWNGLDELRAVSFDLQAGASSNHVLYPNKVRLEGLLPENRSLVNATVLKRVMFAIADCWDIDWGVVDTWAYKGKATDAQGHLLFPYGGWLTYLSPTLAKKVSPPPDIVAERLPNGALFMLVSEKQFDVANPEHIARLDAIQKALAPVQRSAASAAG
jgi:hypothetical protein